MAKYVDFPNELSKNPTYVTDMDVIKESIKRLFFTQQGALIDNPTFGTDLETLLYEQLTDTNKSFIEMEIRRTLAIWEKRVVLKKIEFYEEQDNNKLIVLVGMYVPEFDKDLLVDLEIRR